MQYLKVWWFLVNAVNIAAFDAEFEHVKKLQTSGYVDVVGHVAKQ